MANSGIYEIVNRVNGKRYVGSAVDLDQRWREHRWGLARGKHHSRHLLNAWVKYGAENFGFRVLALCDSNRLLEMEQAEFDRGAPEYNVCPKAGSTLGKRHSEETRKKIGAALLGTKKPPRSPEYRLKISVAHKGRAKPPEHMARLQAGRATRVYTDEQRAQVSESLKTAYRDGNHRRDRPPEYREKIAATLRGRKATPEARANQSAAQLGTKRGPYNIKPETLEKMRLRAIAQWASGKFVGRPKT